MSIEFVMQANHLPPASASSNLDMWSLREVFLHLSLGWELNSKKNQNYGENIF